MSYQVVQSYANAFYEMANEAGKINSFSEEIDALLPVFKDKAVSDFFKSPLFTSLEKEKAVDAALSSQADKDLIDFIKLLARNGRLGYFPQIVEEFKQSCAGEKGVKKGELYSAEELSQSEKKSLQDAIEKKLNMKVQLEFKTSHEILGGIEAKVGSFIIEDSIKSNLKKLNESLKRSSN